MVEIRLLGQFDIRLNGASAKIASRQAEALLAYLVLHAGTPHRREELSGLIWPEATEENARTYLRQALWRLRKAIGDEYLPADRMTISFNDQTDHWLDVTILASEPAGGWTADSLITAVSVYEGDLLPGFYEDWITLERERIAAIYHRQMDTLLNTLTAESRWSDLLIWGERWVAKGSVPEPAYRALMTAHAALSDLTSMTAVYRRCVEALETELGVEPSEETQRLFEQLRKGQLPETARKPLAVKLKQTDEAPAQPAFLHQTNRQISIQDGFFIGREKELALLDKKLSQAHLGQGQVLFITGEAGQGKTTLLQEFTRQAQEKYPDLVVASGACPVYTPVCAPYGLFREVLKMLTGDVESAWAAGTVSQEQAQRLWQLIPETVDSILSFGPHLIDSLVSSEGLIDRARSAAIGTAQIDRLQTAAGHSSHDSGPLSEQGALFAEYADFLVALSRRQPLLIILDDLHWADSSSIGLLGHLGHRLAENPILVVGAYRPEEINQGRDEDHHPLVPVLAEYKRRFGQVSVRLGENDVENGRFFIDALLDKEPNALDETFRAAFTRHTGGHPLFTIELHREMQERGHLRQDEHGQWVLGPNFDWDVIPPRVEGVIETRLSHLPPTLRQWLDLACVEGKVFTAEVIAHINNIEARTAVNRLSKELDRQYRLVTAQSIRQVGRNRQSIYQFRHHLFQQYLYNQLDEIERSYLHLQVGESLEQLFEQQTEEIADLLAYHFQQADVPEKTIIYLTQAGDFATRVYAREDAGDFYKQALSLAKMSNQEGIYTDQLADLYLKLGRTLEHSADAEGALDIYQEMENLGRTGGSESLLLKALVAQGTQYAIPSPVHNPKKSQAISEEALKLSQRMNDQTAEAKTLWNLMTALEYDNQVSRGIEFGEQSLALARELEDQKQLAYTLNDLAGCYYLAGQISQAKTLFEEAAGIWRQLQNKPMQADVLFSNSLACMFTGDFDEVIAMTDEAWALSQSVKNIWGLAMSRSRIGFVRLARGELGLGIEAMEASYHLGREHGLPIPQSVTGAELAYLYAYLGKTELGLEIAEVAFEVANEQTPSYRPLILGAKAQNLLVSGNLKGAEEAIQQARSDPFWLAFPIYCLAPVIVEIRLDLAKAEYGRVLEIGEELLDRLHRFEVRSYLPELLDLMGQALARLGRPEEARNRFLEGRREAEAMKAIGHLWPILFHLSQLETNPEHARALRLQARDIIDYIAAHTGRSTYRESFLALPEVAAVMESAS